MNVSAFRDLWARVVLKVLKIARAVGECNLRTFKTSRVTINHGMHEQVHTIFYLLYSRQSKPAVSHFFIIWCSNLALPRCFHGNFSVLHSITYLRIHH